nr:hypothetical protein [Tanacetum cinerariifolium]
VLEGSGKKVESSRKKAVSKKRTEEEFDQETSKRQKTNESSKLAKQPRDKEVDEVFFQTLHLVGLLAWMNIFLRSSLDISLDPPRALLLASMVPDEQQLRTSSADKGIGTKPGVLDVSKYNLESDKESWGDSGEEDDDEEDDTEDDEGNDDGDDSDGNDDDDDDNDEHKEEDEIVDEFTDKEDHEENKEESDDGEELYKDVNVNLLKEDVKMTDADLEKFLNFKNVSPTDNEIASLMNTIVRTEEPS